MLRPFRMVERATLHLDVGEQSADGIATYLLLDPRNISEVIA